MGQSRTLGAVRSYFSKNRKRLDIERITSEAQARAGGVDVNVVSAQQVIYVTSHGYMLCMVHQVIPCADLQGLDCLCSLASDCSTMLLLQLSLPGPLIMCEHMETTLTFMLYAPSSDRL